MILGAAPIWFGLALLEDGFGKLSRIACLPAQSLLAREAELLREAASMAGKIPFEKLDVLVIDRIGKDISGIGMDSNVTGRHRDLSGDFFLPPNPSRIFVRELSPGSGGNANGIGLADFTTTRLAAALDREKTFTNALAAVSPEKAAIPMHFDTDREALCAALSTSGARNPETARLVRLADTASLAILEASRALADEAEKAGSLSRISDFRPMNFDGQGNLFPLKP